mgnify:CR=1 FL=1
MLKKLFNNNSRASKRYQRQFSAGDSEQRLRVLKEIGDAIATSKLSDIDPELKQLFSLSVATESNVQVKFALIPRIDDIEILATLLDDDATAQTAAQRLVRLTPIDSPLNQKPPVMAERFAAASADQVRALAQIAITPEHMATLAIRAHMEDLDFILRQPLLNSEQGLVALERSSRGRNKTCHKHARERLDALKKGRKSLEDAQQRLQELDATIGKIMSQQTQERPDLEGLKRTRTHLRLLAEKRQSAADELVQTIQELAHAGSVNDTLVVPASPLGDFDLTVPDSKDDHYQKVVDALHQFFSEAEVNGADFEHANRVLQQTNETWHTRPSEYSPSVSQQQTFDRLSAKLGRYATKLQDLKSSPLDLAELPHPLTTEDITAATTEQVRHRQLWLKTSTQAMKKLGWSDDLPLPESVRTMQAALVRVGEEIAQLTEQQSRARIKLRELVGSVKTRLAEGQLKQATQHLAQARKLQRLGYRDCDTEINTLSGELGEMSDWQNYATEPKRQTLLESLQALAEHPLTAPDQTERLKALRQQWNDLGPLRRSDRALQKRFDAMAEQAFAPCKTYFAEQSERRKTNLQKRQAVCEQLAELVEQSDWQQIPLQKIETISRQARAEWQSHHPCERRGLKPLEKRFEALQTQLHEHIRQYKRDNLERKQKIIEDAKALMGVESNKEATQQAKQLQQRWQQIGPAPRQAERNAWEAFRRACDAIFQRSAADYQANQEVLAEQHKALETALATFEQNVSSADLAGLRAQYQAIDDQAATLKPAAAVRKRISAANQTVKELALAAKKAETGRRLEQWRAWDLRVSAAEQAGDVIEPPHSVFSARSQGKARSEDLHRLTLEAEITADIASPAEDQQARMTLQVELINKGLNNLTLIDNKQLIERWCASGPKAASDDSLRSRFFNALAERL